MTRMAAFSDLHGNTPALEAFLEHVERLHVDLIVNLGDIASGGVDPRGTLDLLATRPDIITICGNHEHQLLTRSSFAVGGSDWLAAQVLSDAERAWLRSLPRRAEILPRVLAFHGSPDDLWCYLLETVDSQAGPSSLRVATDDEVTARLGDWAGAADVYFCGHTHLQRTRRLPDGSVIINPGSLGWPAYQDDSPLPHKVEAGTPHARFTLLDSKPDGWSVTECAIDYDVERAAGMALANGRDDVARALTTGRV